MHIKVITPDQEVFEGEIVQAKFPGLSGNFEVLKDHAPLISTIAKGDLILKTDEGLKEFLVDGGVLEVLQNKITVLIESLIQE